MYAVEWKLGELKFYLDGIHYHTINNFKEPNAGTHPQPFDIPFYLRLNMAVGGDYLTPWNDAHNSITDFPASMEVDYVRVYQLNPSCPSQNNCEIVQNSGFTNGTSNWFLQTTGGTAGNLTLDNNGYAKVQVTTTGTSNWQLALRQTGLSLEHGKTYEVSYVAYADAPRSSNVIISKSDGTQYFYQNQALTDSPTFYTYQFTMSAASDTNAYVNVGVGSKAINAYYENISIGEVNCKPCQYNYTIKNRSVIPNIYEVENAIKADGLIESTSQVIFKAKAIELRPNFETQPGAVFKAEVGPCNN